MLGYLLTTCGSWDALAFTTDRKLQQELLEFPVVKPLGLVLISSIDKCVMCESRLQLRKDRPATVVVYDDDMGTVPGSHYHKYCSNPACGVV